MKARWFTKACMLALSLALFGWPATAPAQDSLTTVATTATFLNTGAGTGSAGETVFASQWVAVQFTLTDPSAITDVQGYFGPYGTSGAVNIVIWTNNDSDPTLPVPGQAIWSQSYTLTAPATTAAWVNFPGYLAVLAPGTYWVAFEVPPGSPVNVGMVGPATTPAANSAFFDGGINTWFNFNFGGNHSTNYPAAIVSGYDLGTASGTPLITSGTFARTVTQGSIFNSPCGQNLFPYGNIGQADTLQWNICPGVYSASAYGTIAANPKTTQGNILEAGAYSATGPNGSSGAARGIVFSTYLNTTGKDIPNVQANALLDGSIAGASSNSPVTVAAAVYVFDPASFTNFINSVVPSQFPTLGWYLLGGNNVVAGVGSYYAPNLGQDLFGGNYVDDSWDNNSQFEVCNGDNCPQGYEVSTAGFNLPANTLFTVMFDVTAASQGSASAQTAAIGDFLSTLEADPQYFFTDGNTSVNNGLGNVIAGIAGPLTVALPDTPANISLSPSTQSTAVGSTTVVTASVTDSSNNPVANAIVRFSITSGPHAGFSMPVGTGDGNNGTTLGVATFTYTDTLGTAGTDSISASVGSISAPTPAQVTWTVPGPLYTINLSPATASIALGTGQSYTATGLDFFGNSTDPGAITYSISPDGTCVGSTCTPTATGPHTVMGTGSNPVIGTVTGTASLTVTGASSSLIITASSPTMTFGGTVPTITPLYTYGTSTLTTTAPAGLTTPPVCTTTATSTSPVGSSPSTSCSGAVDANYTISYVPGTVTVNAASLTITASSPTMTFGGTVPTITPLYTYGTSTLTTTAPAGLTTPPICTTTATSTSPVGSSPSTSCSGAVDANYTINYVPRSVTVNAASLTITASSPTMTFGGTVPTITPLYTYGTSTLTTTAPAGLTTPPICTTTATSTSPVGSSPSTSCSGAVDANYTISYVPGSVTVHAASLTITASSPTMTFGGTVPTITPLYTYGTLTLTTTAPAGLTTAPVCSTTATSSSPVGSSPATSCSGAVDANSSISYVPGSVTVTPAALTVTASSPTMTAGGTVPTITPLYTYGTLTLTTTPPSGLTTAPTCSAPGVTSSSSPGTYPTSCSGAVDSNYTIGYVAGILTISNATGKTNPVITWVQPAPITYGTPLSGAQLDATANVAGTFAYNPPAKTILTAGMHTLSVTFTPTNTSAYNTVTATVGLQVNQAAPPVLWIPIPIVYGTPLGPLQLDALTDVPGSFNYTPPAGTVLHAGNQTLAATFTPKDTTDFQTITVHATLIVLKAPPVISWAQPAAITAGTALSATQLDAKANVAGGFAYSPKVGTILPVGTAVLTATFTPTDSADYQAGSAQVSLTVKSKK